MRAPRRVIRPRTSGRLRVRDILASVAGSYSMLSALADAEHSAVPAVRNKSVSGPVNDEDDDSDAVSAAVERTPDDGTGYNAYGTMAVRTTSTVNRGLARARMAESRRPSEWGSCRAARSLRIVEALVGSPEASLPVGEGDGGIAVAASRRRAACLRRWGRRGLSWVAAVCGWDADAAVIPAVGAEEAEPAAAGAAVRFGVTPPSRPQSPPLLLLFDTK